jgi:hypothetical protein
MAQRELRERIQDTMLELKKVKGELGRRYESLMKIAKPMALLVAGYIGLKMTLWTIGTLFSLVWKYSLLFVAMVVFLLLRRSMTR